MVSTQLKIRTFKFRCEKCQITIRVNDGDALTCPYCYIPTHWTGEVIRFKSANMAIVGSVLNDGSVEFRRIKIFASWGKNIFHSVISIERNKSKFDFAKRMAMSKMEKISMKPIEI